MRREYVRWSSAAPSREIELLWFGHAGQPMLWFPTSKGPFYQYEIAGAGSMRRIRSKSPRRSVRMPPSFSRTRSS
jgi:esterase/lipase superfamily enzyme